MPSRALTTGSSRLRTECLRLLTELEAVLCLSCALDRSARANLESERTHIDKATKRELQHFAALASERLSKVRQHFGFSAKSVEVLKLYSEMKRGGTETVARLPLFSLRPLFEDYSQVLKGSERFPAHAQVSFDPHGTHYPDGPHPELFLLEASLFEDMAALYNLTGPTPEWTPDAGKQAIKQAIALQRAAVLAALHFVESYVNGVAIDHLASKGAELTPKQRDELADWDTSRNRPMFLSLPEKFLTYQRIVLNLQHAPLQESNCKEWRTIARSAKHLRDALAHPSAAIDPRTSRREKELVIAALSFEDVTGVVDSAVAVVRQLHNVLHPEAGELWWLHPRDETGRFPDQTFD